MAAWVPWAAFLIVVGASYQTLAKLMAGKLPTFFCTAVIGGMVMLLSLAMLAVQRPAMPPLGQVPARTWGILLMVSLATWCIEGGYLMLYNSGAPLSLARIIMLAGTGLVLLAVGVFLFGENLSRYQLAGIAAILAGLGLLTIK